MNSQTIPPTPNQNPRTAGRKIVMAHLGALLVVAAWGCSFIGSKVLMVDGGFTPIETFVYRFTAAYFLLLLFTFRKIKADSWRDELNFVLAGVCAGSLYFITENYALTKTTTANVSLLASLSPIFTAILMAVFYKVKMQKAVIIGSLISFVGVGFIILGGAQGLELHPAGDVLALSASLCWAVYTIVVKGLIPFYNSFFITRKLFFYGVVSALPLLFVQDAPLHLHLLWDFSQPQYALNFLFLVLMCSAGAYLIWNEVMKYLGSVMANNYMYLQPVVTMIAAWLLLGEGIVWTGYVGCALIIGGLVFSDKLKNRF